MPESRINSMDDAVEQLRQRLQDTPETNRLKVGEELGDEDLEQCIHMAIDEFSTLPPIIGDFGVSDFPSDSLLMRAGTIWALEQAGFLQSRNRLQYSDNGLNVQVSDKAQDYQAWIQQQAQRYYQTARRIKIQENVRRAYGGSSSAYDLTS